MHERSSRIAFIISLFILLGSLTYAIRMQSPTGKFLGITACWDTDKGVAPFVDGYARDITHKVHDLCIDERTIYEAYCDEDGKAKQVAIRCPVRKSCVNRACEQ